MNFSDDEFERLEREIAELFAPAAENDGSRDRVARILERLASPKAPDPPDVEAEDPPPDDGEAGY